MTTFTIRDKDLDEAKDLCVKAMSEIKNRNSWRARQDINKVNNILMNCKELKA